MEKIEKISENHPIIVVNIIFVTDIDDDQQKLEIKYILHILQF